jgi:hypothetical protein
MITAVHRGWQEDHSLEVKLVLELSSFATHEPICVKDRWAARMASNINLAESCSGMRFRVYGRVWIDCGIVP